MILVFVRGRRPFCDSFLPFFVPLCVPSLEGVAEVIRSSVLVGPQQAGGTWTPPPPPPTTRRTGIHPYTPSSPDGSHAVSENPGRQGVGRPRSGHWGREWFEPNRSASLDLNGDSSFPRSLRGSKPRPEPSKMGKCDGRCTLLVICALQLVRVHGKIIYVLIYSCF